MWLIIAILVFAVPIGLFILFILTHDGSNPIDKYLK